MFSASLRSALATVVLLAAGTLLAADATDEKPKLTARPQSFNSGLTLTTLDEKTAFERSQAAIGRQVGDFVLLDRQGKPVELSRYRGKPAGQLHLYRLLPGLPDHHPQPAEGRPEHRGRDGRRPFQRRQHRFLTGHRCKPCLN